MLQRKITRRRFLALTGAALTSSLLSRVAGQSSASVPLRVGAVIPTRREVEGLTAFNQDAVGEAARLGATLAWETLADRAEAAGFHLDLLIAAAPDGETAGRAAARLVEGEGAVALLGGSGPAQAEAVAVVAARAGVPFLDIGDSDTDCRPTTFQVGADASMYLEALASWFADAGTVRWHVVQADSAMWRDRFDRLAAAAPPKIKVSRTVVPENEPIFEASIDDAAAAGADLIVLLVEASAQLVFLGQYEGRGLPGVVTGYPEAAAQLRAFYAAALEAAPTAGVGPRVALWDARLDSGAAGALNDRFITRWGRPMDPTAWAAYSAVQVIVDAATASGTVERQAVFDYLADAAHSFELGKGPGVAFALSGQRLAQPIYVVAPDGQASLGLGASKLLNVANVLGQVPNASPATEDPSVWWKRFGPSGDSCAAPR